MPPIRSPQRARRPSVVAIDGPAGAGKSTVARAVARALAYAYLDTGAMYRALTAAAIAAGIPSTDARALRALARSLDLRFDAGGLVVDGRRAGRGLRTRAVAAEVSAVSAHPGVRREMVERQRALLAKGRIVAEGRDIGTVVCPQAPVKVFLTASVTERARRRRQDHQRAGERVALATLEREIARRDRLDSTRRVSPLRPARDAVTIDTTGKSARRVVAEIVELARAAGLRPGTR